jgi:hypothetical protein
MLTFEIGSDLYNAGYTEDGVPFTAERFFVSATDDNGNRWVHNTQFDGCRVEQNEEGFSVFFDTRTEATARAARLVARINAAGGSVNLALWNEARPVYGSIAYQEYGQYNDWMQEKGQFN